MNYLISIRPSKDLRNNYAKISALSRENPVAITVNGKEDTVLLSHEEFRKQQIYITELEEKIKLYSTLSTAMDDIKLGRTKNANDVFDEILIELEKYNI